MPTPLPTIPVRVVDGGLDPFAVMALIVSILALSATILGGLWALRAARRRSLMAPPELANALSDLNDAFNDMTARGGWDSHRFLEPDQKELMARLSVLATHIVDNRLNGLVGIALSERHSCWTYGAERFRTEQLKAADRGKRATVEGIERCGELYRLAAGL